MCRCAKTLIAFAWMMFIPSLTFAQATLAGNVKDASGAVLPGVTVEAASPALIEKVRIAITDSSGQYRIEDLRPGQYTVTFKLSGFAAVTREGLTVSGAGTIPLNAEMKVGNVQETVTVQGENPVVDVQSTKRQVILDNETIRAIPSVRSYSSLLITVPGVETDRNNVPTGPLIAIFPIHGGRMLESRLTVDGLNVGNPPGGNQPSHYVADVGNANEISFTTSGGLGENETSGLIMNIVPKTGGNRLSGSIFYSGTGENLQANNFTDELKARGLIAATPLRKVYDVNGAVGGPIRKDRVWYFVNARTQGQTRNIPNLFYNRNAGDPTKWTYDPDLSRPAYSDRTWENISARFTVQASPRHKFAVFWDEQAICRKCTGTTSFSGSPSATTAPEADGFGDYNPQRVQQATWSSPMTNRLLLDAAIGTSYYQWGNSERPDNQTRDLVRILQLGPTQIVPDDPATSAIDPIVINGLTYRSQNFLEAGTNAVTWRGTGSFVTGAHSVKVGYQGNWWKDDRTIYTNDQNLTYFALGTNPLNGNPAPLLLQEAISPFTILARAAQTSLFAQEQWTRGQLTLQGGIRYDRAWSWFPEQSMGPTRFVPARVVFPAQDGVRAYNDITPRIGAAYDVFGNGETAVKMNLGKYLEGASSSGIYYNTNPTMRIAGNSFGFLSPSVTRFWADADGNLTPDCNLSDPFPNLGPNDFCGIISDLNFGTSQLSNTYDPSVLSGWGVRPSDWAFGLSVSQEIVPRASIEVAYHQRWFTGFTVIDNQAVPASGYDRFSFTAPSDPQLPNGGGYAIDGLYNLNPAYVGLAPNNLITRADAYGDQYRHFKGVDVTLNVRTAHGLTFQGGTSTGQTVQDNCEIVAAVPESSIPGFGALTNYCHTASGVQTQFRGLAAYTVPGIDVQLSTVYQDKPGRPFIDTTLAANYNAPNDEILSASTLGRSLSANAPTITVNLVEPGTLYGDRIRELDFSVKKILRFRGTTATVGFDLYNVLNSNVTLQYNTTYTRPTPGSVSGWLAPTEIMTARLARFTAELSW